MSGCHCGYGYENEDCDECCTLWREGRIKKTRTAHKCCECAEAIPPGSTCCFSASLFDGRWETEYRCVSCSTLVELVAEINRACPQWGSLWAAADAAGVDYHAWQAKARSLEERT